MEEPEKQGICTEIVFTQFFKKNFYSLRNYLYFKFGSDNLADDIAQDAFIKLWQHCAEVRFPKSFLYRVANNASLNELAYQKVELKYRDSKPNDTTDYASPEYLMEETEFRDKFDKAIASLTQAQRTALLLNRIEGKKYREIAEMLGISQKAVEKRIHGALLSMREQIDHFR
ncbi:MAG TPA: RNA polymerase sigma factor [Flavobacterium sp.]|nr:RNA polymerase sigma factor [Flavobacterium sp.]HPJ11323.1 RNA polymerase sigma factor [Flavobacterium sp.]